MLIADLPEGLCLDYANTLYWRGRATPSEGLHALADLIGWLENAARLDARALAPVRAWAAGHPAKAAEVFAEAVAIREAIYRIFRAFAEGAAVAEADFALVTRALQAAPARQRLARANGGYGWEVETRAGEPGEPAAPNLLAPVLWSAGDLMLNAPHRRIRRCANHECVWLFVDDSKSGTRRWCDMSSCGNRAKARRHYAKSKGE